MGLIDLQAFLRRNRRLALDTSPLIYQLERNPRYAAFTDFVFEWLEKPGNSAVTSTVTMAELLVKPYRDANRRQVNNCYALFSTYPNLQWIAPDLEAADIAARLRAQHRLRTPDALQAATAIQAQATGLVTNDLIFKHLDQFETLVLEDLV